MDDFRSVRARIFARLQAIDEVSADDLLIPGINAYNQGDYESALSRFVNSAAQVQQSRRSFGHTSIFAIA